MPPEIGGQGDRQVDESRHASVCRDFLESSCAPLSRYLEEGYALTLCSSSPRSSALVRTFMVASLRLAICSELHTRCLGGAFAQSIARAVGPNAIRDRGGAVPVPQMFPRGQATLIASSPPPLLFIPKGPIIEL